MKYEKALQYLEEHKVLGSVPGLLAITKLMEKLGNPQNEMKFVHVAGTNGKGSVSSYIASVLTEAGYVVGKYTSPEVFAYTERFSVCGKNISQKDFGRIFEDVAQACDELEKEGFPHPTVFEMETAVSFCYFKEKGCSIAVLECGMGGRLDATNLVTTTAAAVFTSISMDHMAYLGNTLAKIAAEKSGIIKDGAIVVSGIQNDEVSEVLRKNAESNTYYEIRKDNITGVSYKAESMSFDYEAFGVRLKGIKIPLIGSVQPENAALAILTVCALSEKGFEVSEENIRNGLMKTVWPGRFEKISGRRKPAFYIDGAHNEDAAKRLFETVNCALSGKRIILIMGVLADKEYEKVAEIMAGVGEMVITIMPPDNSRALSSYDLAKAVKKFNPNVTALDSIEEAVEFAYVAAGEDGVILAFGSLSYLGRLSEIVHKKQDKRKW